MLTSLTPHCNTHLESNFFLISTILEKATKEDLHGRSCFKGISQEVKQQRIISMQKTGIPVVSCKSASEILQILASMHKLIPCNIRISRLYMPLNIISNNQKPSKF